VKRVFAGLRAFDDEWGLNILVFDKGTVEQITTGVGAQDAACTGFRYDDAAKTISFGVNGSIEEVSRMGEISVETFDVMMRSDNWQRLCYGLQQKSQKTWDWCVKRGICS
jgi:hypothetical protein